MRAWNDTRPDRSETLYMLDFTDALKTKTRTSTKSHVLPSKTQDLTYLAGNWTNCLTVTIYHG